MLKASRSYLKVRRRRSKARRLHVEGLIKVISARNLYVQAKRLREVAVVR